MRAFSDYFSEWLYGDEGYYNRALQIGKGGDFYTAVSASSFFGGSIANHLIKQIDAGALSSCSLVLEIGAHKGYLMADMIQFIYTLKHELLKTLKFAIVEPLKPLAEMQKAYLEQSFGNGINLSFFSSLDEVRVESAFVVANELFDAFPCELVIDGKMACVDEHQRVVFGDMRQEIADVAARYKIEKGEIPVGYGVFINKLSKIADRMEFVTFDYGEKAPKGEFSVRVYRGHQVYPLFEIEDRLGEFFGVSDITSDVHFGYLIDTFLEQGFELVDFEYQSKALVDFGIIELLDILRQKASEKAYLHETNKIKTLIHPSFMGERFKMLKLSKGGVR